MEKNKTLFFIAGMITAFAIAAVGLFFVYRQTSLSYATYVQAMELESSHEYMEQEHEQDEFSGIGIDDNNGPCPQEDDNYPAVDHPADEADCIEEYDDPYVCYDAESNAGYEYYEDYIPYVPLPPIFTSEPLPDHIIEFITGVTFKEYTPFTHCFLTYLTITFVDFEGEDQIGHMIVAAEIGDEVLEIFQEIYEGGFSIYSIKLIDYFDAVDYYSLAANNSSAFNFRYIANTTTLSRHAYGMAIDINPIQNPYVRGDNVLPAAGKKYLDRTDVRPGMIVSGDVVYRAFTSRGWIWGGNWTLPRDYHHFERRG